MLRTVCLMELVLVCAFLAGCRSPVEIPTEFPTPPGPEPAKPAAKLEFKRDAELEKQFAKIADEAKGRVGVAAVVLETGEAAFLNADEHYPMQSVYKLPIAMAMMEQIRLGNHDLDEVIGVTKDEMVRQGQASALRDKNPDGGEFTIRELIRLALVESDGSASDVLLRVLGGPSVVQSYLTQIGINDMKVVNTEKEIGRDWETQYENWTTPREAVELVRSIKEKWENDLDLEQKELRLIKFMKESIPGKNRLKGLLPKKTVVAHKTGTGGTQDRITSATNDIGVIYLPNGNHLAVAVFVSDSRADEKNREGVIAKIARAAFDRWAGLELTTAAKSKVATCWTTMSWVDREICSAALGRNVITIESDYGKPVELSYVKRDLNSDGRKEMIIWESSWSGTSGGSFIILSDDKKGYRKLYETEMTWSPIIYSKRKHLGWNDMVYHVRGGGVDPVFVTVKFNGKKYVQSSVQEEPPAGEVVIGKNWVQGYFGPMTVSQ